MKRWLAAAAGVVVLCVVPVGPAHAAPGGDATSVASFFIAPLGSTGALASCPAGQRVTGGGLGTTANPASGGLQMSAPVDEFGGIATTLDGDIGRSWSGNVFSFVDGTTFRTFGLCSATSDAVVYESFFSVPATSDGGAFETCPVGTRVVGGGVGTTESDAVVGMIKQTTPLGPGGTVNNTVAGQVGRTWGAFVRNTSGVTRGYRVLVVCSAASDATIETTSFTVPSQTGADNVAACPPGKRALGGGVGTLGDPTRVRISQPLNEAGTNPADGQPARQWRASVFNLAAVAVVFKVFALCATDDLGGTPVPPTPPAPAPPAPGTPTPGAPGSAPSTGGIDTTSPALGGLSLSRTRFRAGSSRTTTVRFALSESARVVFTVERASRGRRVNGRCVQPRRSNRRARPCTRYTAIGSFRRDSSTGQNAFTYSGRLNGRRLRAGSYRLRVVATDAAGNRSGPVFATFRIIR